MVMKQPRQRASKLVNVARTLDVHQHARPALDGQIINRREVKNNSGL